MHDILHLIASQPLATMVTGLCLLLVTGLLLSDWAEKRRERQLLLARARLRGGNPDPALDKALRESRPVFRLFRWEFLLLSLALVGLFAPDRETDAWPVNARTADPASAHTDTDPAVESPIQLPSLSLAVPIKTPADYAAFESESSTLDSEPAEVDFAFFSPKDANEENPRRSSISDVRTSYRPWSPM